MTDAHSVGARDREHGGRAACSHRCRGIPRVTGVRRVLPAAGRAGRRADPGRGPPLQPAPHHPRRRDERSEATEERQGAGHRRRRAGQSGSALSGRGGRGHARDRRVRRGGRVQPAAPDHPRAVRHREAEGRLGEGVDRRDQPPGERRRAQRAARQRQRAGDLRGLRPDRRRHRQLRDPLPGQRRGVLLGDPLRLGLDLPVRRAGQRVRADPRRRRPVLPLPLPRAATAGHGARAARRAVCWACCAPASARSR